jgi:hypothetical protein
MEYLSKDWEDYIAGKIPIEDVIDSYDKNGFDVNQDVPGNYYWQELYKAQKNCKVILTVRDNEEQWFNSIYKFYELAFINRRRFDMLLFFSKYRICCAEATRMLKILRKRLFGINFETFKSDILSKEGFVELKEKKELIKNVYRSHNKLVEVSNLSS